MLLGTFPPLSSLRSFEVPKRDVENLADYVTVEAHHRIHPQPTGTRPIALMAWH